MTRYSHLFLNILTIRDVRFNSSFFAMEQMIRDHIAGAALRAMFRETPPRERGPGPFTLPFDGAYEAGDGSYESNDGEVNFDSVDNQQALQRW
ncbi:hypothetical protein TWF192_005277 [Orbilia oligospora]|nr:hypothetical protein TWF192_005277 [Orbilia oligospora]